MAEDPKRFFKTVLERGPYYEVLQLMAANPNWSLGGKVVSDRGRYVHENSTNVELMEWGHLGAEETWDTPEEAGTTELVERLRTTLQDQVRTWNHELTKQLYAELEAQQSDEVLIDWMGANEWRFDEDGERIDMSGYTTVANLKPGIRDKVLRDYAELFERTPEQVYTSLMQRGVMFDKRGSRVDTSAFKKVNELDEPTRSRILDKYRNILVEDDNTWAEPVESDWIEKLEGFGFERIDIRYSLGYSQGDGASFTADSIDVKVLCEAMLRQKQVEAAATALVSDVLE